MLSHASSHLGGCEVRRFACCGTTSGRSSTRCRRGRRNKGAANAARLAVVVRTVFFATSLVPHKLVAVDETSRWGTYAVSRSSVPLFDWIVFQGAERCTVAAYTEIWPYDLGNIGRHLQ